ncbi:hypothetical protein [Thermaerobacillus caldiproteolyticus]|uniref:Ornithine cyclodeaminase/alanine dehydrogenase-like protein (Mu-crystallin family) n=1 Tax=Thermaerobacillus caldiproteolyticus TaxID=247480 RepID=A0A7V9Z8K2_9BACL|nr:hypothetical protein [Anoxybacillus caldiproteolyticus]MBA2876047.1 ornithine cyclodeaminase/alanine dehydrogenase-like protein (mu-crystallin family) [Anoxybacillus caldiproteolyticus]QPA33364.1 hypothetical protein ISX45_04660 [Anoxybacillus caldiproteolyticus]
MNHPVLRLALEILNPEHHLARIGGTARRFHFFDRKIAYGFERVLTGELQQESLELDEPLEQKLVISKEIEKP